ncbi:hypothetical protein SEQ_HALENA_127 [Mycobacterium phage Halena]|uniref:Uncharacterized protein n=7 Tax=Bronvirus TaxID=1623278 RepID=E0YPQ0_9CAUD|nr:hypothetical protein LEBRON_126 [Mycobacterium phage LeBron]YP_009635965.1 hypothetical protein FGG55_gp109 [Mycobacterium phage JoeDirt]YP_010101011.1 hypothetical protein KNU44_gp102 [Mycobacterium phage CicholasNage]YP_010114812.1 hypothetical protein KNV76_gp104 [Mycobacterium phage OhShagHennessy]AEK07634.1 hypothetical protein UPIE_126 [Mycobacterium phage UPIE]AEZ50784.1 hypothetical protein [Mycobacterium phage Fezzik]ASR86096.1 hypothetical protein SEA_APPLETREE2_126 [Mycobacteriu
MGRGRGSGGGKGGGKGKNGGNPDELPIDKPSKVDDAANKTNDPNQAADELGLEGKDKDHFVNGANAEDRRLTPGTSPDEAVQKFQLAVKAYERKYGRGAARMYSRGAYWSLVRFLKTAFAVASTVQQGGSAPALAAVNTALLAAYWIDRAKK